MTRPDGLDGGIDPTNGLIGQSRGRSPGSIGGADLNEQWTKTYHKYAWEFPFDAQGVMTVRRYVLYAVTVRGDGSIRVNQGDWISKYSDAIHGKPWRWNEYARKNSHGVLTPIVNVHRIFADETIYHLPSVPRISGITLVSQTEPTQQEKLQAILDHLKNARDLNDDVLTNLGNVLDGVSKTVDTVDKILTVAEFITDIAQTSGRATNFLGAASQAVGAVGVILGFVMIPFQMAELGRREFGVQQDAAIAATVAYAFDDLKPKPSEYNMANIAQMFPQDIEEYKENWNKVVDKTYAHLRGAAVRQVKATILKEGEHPLDPELALKVGLRVLAKNDRNKLRSILREKYADK